MPNENPHNRSDSLPAVTKQRKLRHVDDRLRADDLKFERYKCLYCVLYVLKEEQNDATEWKYVHIFEPALIIDSIPL